jgi:ketosteroid isomerase-like protein
MTTDAPSWLLSALITLGGFSRMARAPRFGGHAGYSGEASMTTASSAMATEGDLELLTALNRDYIASVQNGDVRRFDEILAEDFLCSNPDGSLLDKRQFLAQTARPVTISGLAIDDVRIRLLGDVAIIHARTSYRTADGAQRNGRYTDVWARRDGGWLAVSAHVMR